METKKRFILRETKNYIAYGNFEDESVDIELKPTCERKVREMWGKLHEPIRRKRNGLQRSEKNFMGVHR